MKLIELLQERELAGVYTNIDKTLQVIGNAFKDVNFHISFPGGSVSGACLLSNIIYSISQVTNISEKDIADSLDQHWLVNFPWTGKTLEEILKNLTTAVIHHGKKKVKVKCSVEVFHSIDGVLKDVTDGQPVILIATAAPHGLYAHSASPRVLMHGGIVPAKPIDNDQGLKDTMLVASHSYLIVGYDKAEDYIIARDIKSSYSYMGYLKIHREALKKNFKKFKFLSVVVDKVEDVSSRKT